MIKIPHDFRRYECNLPAFDPESTGITVGKPGKMITKRIYFNEHRCVIELDSRFSGPTTRQFTNKILIVIFPYSCLRTNHIMTFTGEIKLLEIFELFIPMYSNVGH